MSEAIHILLHRSKLIFLVGVIFAVASFAVTLLFPLKYRSDAQVLIISKSRYGVDPYTVVKSAERVGDNIAQIMQTDDFLNKVRATGAGELDWSGFDSLNDRQKRKAWPKMVNSSVVYGTGALNVSAYSVNPDQAKKLTNAVVGTLESRGWEYVGADVIIKGVNNPVTTKWPVKPNLAVNALIGFLAGAVLMGVLAVKKQA